MSTAKKQFGLEASTLHKIRQIFSKYPDLEKVILYGSRAKGNYREGSDIDLCFYGKKLTAETLYRIDEALEELLLPYLFDLSLYHEIDNSNLLDHIKRRGKCFYQTED